MSDLNVEKIIGYSKGNDCIDRFILDGRNFISKVGRSSIIITWKDENGDKRKRIFSDEFKDLRFMGYLKKIKSEISKNLESVMSGAKWENASETNEYFKFSRKLNQYRKNEGDVREIQDCYEVDLTAAYYQAAYRLGYISEELYFLIIKKVPKDERLWLLGAIATSYTVTEYQCGEVVGDPSLLEDEGLRTAWKNICQFIDYVMMDIKKAINDEFLFYWVDGIYFKGDNDTREVFDRIRMVTWRHKLMFKTVPIPSMKITTTERGLEIELNKADGSKKCFNVNKRLLVEYRQNSFKKLSEFDQNELYSQFLNNK